MKKRIRTILLLLIALTMSVCIAACGRKPCKAVILYTNDVHCNVKNYPLLSAYVADLKDKGENVILGDGGDNVQGSFLGMIDEGASIINIMNSAGYDFAVPGNHDYDYGMDVFLNNAENSDFAYVSCNFSGTQQEREAFIHEPYFMAECNGHNVAFIGIETTDDIGTCIEPVQRAVDDARRNGAQLVIAVGHIGVNAGEELMENTTGVDIFLNAHDHLLCDGEDNKVSYVSADGRDVPVFEAGANMEYICRLDVLFTDGSFEYEVSMKTQEDIQSELGETMSAKAAAAMKNTEDKVAGLIKQKEELNYTVGKSECVLCVYDPVKFPMCNDFIEYNSSDMVADAYRSVAETDIAMVNTTALRNGIQKGYFGKMDLCDFIPWFENVYAADLTGRQIMDILERDTVNWPKYTENQPAVSGMTFSVDTTKKAPGRVYDVKIGDEPIDLSRTYSVASSSYYLFEATGSITGIDESKCRCIGMDCDVLERYITETLGGVIPDSLYGSLSGDGRIHLEFKDKLKD